MTENTTLRDHLYQALRAQGVPGAPGEDDQPPDAEIPEETTEPEDPQYAWLRSLSPEEFEAVQTDGRLGVQLHARWLAAQGQPVPTTQTVTIPQASAPPGVDIAAVEAYERSELGWADLREPDLAEAMRRHIARGVAKAADLDRRGIRR